MQDVLVLLQHLAENEATTIKLIIDCLYDVGAVNFINREVQNPAVNQFTKKIASLSKPVAKRYGLYWFKKNCPQLIVNWLQRKVAFLPSQKTPLAKTEVENQPDIVKALEVAEAQAQSDDLLLEEAVPQSVAENHHQSIDADPSPITTEKDNSLAAELNILEAEEPSSTVPSPPRTLDNISIPLEKPVVDRANSSQHSIASTQIAAGEALPELESPPSALSELETSTHLVIDPGANTWPDMPLTGLVSQADSVLRSSTEVNSSELPHVSPRMEPEIRQIRQLRTQIKVLAGTLVGTTLMSGVMIWHLHTTPRNALDLQQSIPSSIVPSEQGGD